MRITKRRLGLFLAFAVAAALLAFAFRPKAVTVQSAAVSTGEIVTTVDEDGITRVAERYELNAPISGRHLRVRLRTGDSVTAGDVIAEFEPAELDPRTLAQTKARLDSAIDTARSADAAVRGARDLLVQANRERSRVEKLGAIVSRNDLDQARTVAANRQADLTAAVARADASKHDIETLRAAMAAAAEGGTLQLRAPATGQVLRVASESEATVAAGTSIAEIGDPRHLELVIDVLSPDAVHVRPGQTVVIDGWGGDAPLKAAVQRIEPSGFMKVSALGIEEQRVNVIADVIDPPSQLGDRFQVQAHIVVWSGKALRVPMTALFRSGDTWSVFAIRNGRAQQQRVEIGHRGGSDVEVVSGLAAGTRVVVHPSDQIRANVRVKGEASS
ncbi:MAG TPA: HlyD family efflux transporter periplasmic adaptor subunit [Thermoanaerobaculia bacterium]|jgi:HlyD family secretion protein|nr:HlyD family efflux transporter periplasmic adaptor subunit [Thermoanaerobaculia bacterium]